MLIIRMSELIVPFQFDEALFTEGDLEIMRSFVSDASANLPQLGCTEIMKPDSGQALSVDQYDVMIDKGWEDFKMSHRAENRPHGNQRILFFHAPGYTFPVHRFIAADWDTFKFVGEHVEAVISRDPYFVPETQSWFIPRDLCFLPYELDLPDKIPDELFKDLLAWTIHDINSVGMQERELVVMHREPKEWGTSCRIGRLDDFFGLIPQGVLKAYDRVIEAYKAHLLLNCLPGAIENKHYPLSSTEGEKIAAELEQAYLHDSIPMRYHRSNVADFIPHAAFREQRFDRIFWRIIPVGAKQPGFRLTEISEAVQRAFKSTIPEGFHRTVAFHALGSLLGGHFAEGFRFGDSIQRGKKTPSKVRKHRVVNRENPMASPAKQVPIPLINKN